MADRVLVIGGGIIGCAIAHDLAAAGRDVHIVERTRPGAGSSGAALGLLFAHLSYGDDFDQEMLAIEQESLSGYESWAGRLTAESGIDPELARNGLLEVAFDEAHLDAMKARGERERALGIAVELLDVLGARDAQDDLSPEVVGAALYPDAIAIDARLLTQAAADAAVARGASLMGGVEAVEILRDGGRVTGVRTSQGTRLAADLVIVASGSEASRLLGGAVPYIRPVRGQVVALEPTLGTGGPSVTDGAVTVVPRGGHVLCGGTVEEAGFDKRNTAGGLARILPRAIRMRPALADAPIAAMWSGLRPATEDGRPFVGVVEPGLMAAVGHFRSGLILAPWTARRILELV